MPTLFLSLILLAASTTSPAQVQAPPAPMRSANPQQALDAAKAANAPLFYRGEDKRSAATRKVGPERWGLAARDFSVTCDEALASKAGLPARWKEIKAAADAGDAFAQHLAGVYLRLPIGGKKDKQAWQYFDKAAAQGLVRADADVIAHAWDIAETDEEDAEAADALGALWLSDNAHAKHLFGLRSILHGNVLQGMQSVQYGAHADYAPAHLLAADLILKQGKTVTPEMKRASRWHAERAAALGLSAAVAYLAKHPAN